MIFINHSRIDIQGGVAQMVERSLSMREVPGSIPGISILLSHLINIAAVSFIVRVLQPISQRFSLKVNSIKIMVSLSFSSLLNKVHHSNS